MNGVSFPQLAARDLGGREVALPAGLPGERNVVLIAFRRDQQQLVDSWVPWLEQRAAADPGLRFVELPALGLQWEPARPAIDGGMAAAIRDQAVRRRTLTVYTDLRRVTVPLGIDDRSTIWLCLVDRAGRVAWRGSGGLDPATAAALDTALATAPEPAAAAAQAAGPEAEQFEMAFDPRFRLPLAALGVTPATAHVTVAADRLVACFGPWVCRTAPANVQEVRLTGPYRWYRAIGPRLSLADHGLTFGSTPARGVCLLFREPVPGIGPLGLIRHPDLTLTAADPERLAATVRRHAGLPGSRTLRRRELPRWPARGDPAGKPRGLRDGISAAWRASSCGSPTKRAARAPISASATSPGPALAGGAPDQGGRWVRPRSGPSAARRRARLLAGTGDRAGPPAAAARRDETAWPGWNCQ